MEESPVVGWKDMELTWLTNTINQNNVPISEKSCLHSECMAQLTHVLFHLGINQGIIMHYPVLRMSLAGSDTNCNNNDRSAKINVQIPSLMFTWNLSSSISLPQLGNQFM